MKPPTKTNPPPFTNSKDKMRKRVITYTDDHWTGPQMIQKSFAMTAQWPIHLSGRQQLNLGGFTTASQNHCRWYFRAVWLGRSWSHSPMGVAVERVKRMTGFGSRRATVSTSTTTKCGVHQSMNNRHYARLVHKFRKRGTKTEQLQTSPSM
jgi:hypothetical protein